MLHAHVVYEQSTEYLFVQVNDESALSHSAKDALYKSYPDARRAHLKSGGNFPYLSRPVEVNLYIQVCCTVFVDMHWAFMVYLSWHSSSALVSVKIVAIW